MKHRPGNAQHIGARDEQQDAFAFSDLDDPAFVAHGGVLALVADGMGGLAHGRAASAQAVRVFLEVYCGKRREQTVPSALAEALARANESVVALLRRHAEATAGTTLAAAVLHDAGLHWVSVGDSRIYLWRAGQLEAVTVDHVYAHTLADKVARGTITAGEAASHPDRDTLISYLGRDPLPVIDCSRTPMPLRLDDLVLVCTDGVYRALGEAGLQALAASEPDPQALCERAIDAVVERQRRHQDNCTMLAVSSRAVSERPAHATR